MKHEQLKKYQAKPQTSRDIDSIYITSEPGDCTHYEYVLTIVGETDCQVVYISSIDSVDMPAHYMGEKTLEEFIDNNEGYNHCTLAELYCKIQMFIKGELI